MTAHERTNRVRSNETCVNWLNWKETKTTNKNKISDNSIPACIKRWLGKRLLVLKWLHLQNCTPNHLSILPDDINYRSHLVLKVIKICWRNYVHPRGWGRHRDLFSWRLYPTYQPHLQNKEKRTNLTIFDSFFFQFRPYDGHPTLSCPPPQKNLAPSLHTLKSSGHRIKIIGLGTLETTWPV